MKRMQAALIAATLLAGPAIAIEDDGDSGLGQTGTTVIQPATIRNNTSSSAGGIVVPILALLLLIAAAAAAAD
jgi:hypothetical protein